MERADVRTAAKLRTFIVIILDKTRRRIFGPAQTELANPVSQKTIDHTSECF